MKAQHDISFLAACFRKLVLPPGIPCSHPKPREHRADLSAIPALGTLPRARCKADVLETLLSPPGGTCCSHQAQEICSCTPGGTGKTPRRCFKPHCPDPPRKNCNSFKWLWLVCFSFRERLIKKSRVLQGVRDEIF